MRKGQVTLFIIIGLVLVIGTFITVAVYQNWLVFRPPSQQTSSNPDTQIKPVLSMIEQCQEHILSQGVRELLAHGGYIDPATHGIIALPPPAGNGFALTSTDTVAYWRFIQGGQEATKEPLLYDIGPDAVANQLAAYVDAHLDSCVDFKTLSGYDIVAGNHTSQVTFTADATTVTTTWPLTINLTSAVAHRDAFQATIQAPVQSLFNTADETVQGLRDIKVPEGRMLAWLAIYATPGTTLPPMDGGLQTTWDFAPYTLSKGRPALEDVEQRMAQSLQVIGSKDWQFVQTTNSETVNQLYLNSLLAIPDQAPNTTVRFSADPAVPQYWAVNGNPVVAVPKVSQPPSAISWLVPPIVDESFRYDLQFPLIIRLQKDGYTLTLGYQVNIKDNHALEAGQLVRSNQQDYCTGAGGRDVRIHVTPESTEATVSYTCGSETCPLGTTDHGLLLTTLPSCASGTIEASANGLFGDEAVVASDPTLPAAKIEMQLQQPRPVTIQVETRAVQQLPNGTYTLATNAIPSVDGHVILSRHGTPYTVQANSGDTISLVPGTYDVYVVGIDNYSNETPFQIPAQHKCVKVAGVITIKCYDIPEVNMTAIPVLYADYSGQRAVTITSVPDTLDVIAAGMDPAKLQTVDDLGYMGALFNLSSTISPQDAVKSVFKTIS